MNHQDFFSQLAEWERALEHGLTVREDYDEPDQHKLQGELSTCAETEAFLNEMAEAEKHH
ncbi:MAG: hypothetical protein HKN50_13715 [Gammaproteobacteria bacterium]|nr:hypothetical protein [Gammaproteobacteria bacterium]